MEEGCHEEEVGVCGRGAVGFLLGSRSGRRPYEQFESRVRQWSGHPKVQQVADQVGESAGQVADQVTESTRQVGDAAADAAATAADRAAEAVFEAGDKVSPAADRPSQASPDAVSTVADRTAEAGRPGQQP